MLVYLSRIVYFKDFSKACRPEVCRLPDVLSAGARLSDADKLDNFPCPILSPSSFLFHPPLSLSLFFVFLLRILFISLSLSIFLYLFSLSLSFYLSCIELNLMKSSTDNSSALESIRCLRNRVFVSELMALSDAY